MCLIAHRRHKSEEFYPEYFESSAVRNKDGIGIMYLKQGRVFTKKLGGDATDAQKKELYQEFQKAPVPAFLHLRYGTHGNRANYDNAHPFKILDKDEDGVDLYMMHNGMLRVQEIDKERSDTWHFVNFYLKPMLKRQPYLLTNPFFKLLIAGYITGSRLVFLYSCGQVVLFEDSQCHDDEEFGGCWLSNRGQIGTPSTKYAAPYNARDYDDDGGYYGYHHHNYGNYPYRNRDNDSNVTNLFDKKENPNMTKKDEAQEKLELERAASTLGDNDTDTPDDDDVAPVTLPETVDEQIMMLGEMSDEDIYDFVCDQPQDASDLLSNLKDYYTALVADKKAA